MSAEVNVTPADNKDEDAQATADALARAEHGLEGDQSTTEPDKTARPDWCPEKFARFNDDGSFNASQSAEALSKGHGELEKQFTQKQQTNAEPTEDELEEQDNAPADTNDSDDDDAPLTDANFWNSLTEEYNEKQELSPESRKILADLGVPDQMVDDYIAGQLARGDQYHNQATSVLGDNGAAEYDALVDWASAGGMSDEEAAIFNAAVTSGDVTKAQIAIRDLKAQYIRAEGSYGNLELGGGPGGQAGAQPFPSRQQMTDAIRDPRYSKDPAYRAEIEKRIAVTTL